MKTLSKHRIETNAYTWEGIVTKSLKGGSVKVFHFIIWTQRRVLALTTSTQHCEKSWLTQSGRKKK